MRILLTGGTGFFGSHIKDELEKNGYTVYTFSRSKYNLLDYEATRAAFIDARADYVIHAAGVQGGISYNINNPAKMLSENIRMASNVFEAANEFKPKKILSIISGCAYPDKSISPVSESTLMDGRAHDSVAAHGFAKRFLQEASIAYNQQYGLNAVTVAVTNLFGPRANFHLENSKVVEATIQKLTSDQDVEFWGRGVEKRHFIYVKDAAFCVVKALELYERVDQPLNIGSTYEVSIKELVDKVKKITNFTHKIKWDKSRPDGCLRRMLDISTLTQLFKDYNIDFIETPFEEALSETINWYTSR